MMQLKKTNNEDQLQLTLIVNRQESDSPSSFASDRASIDLRSKLRPKDIYYLPPYTKCTVFQSFRKESSGISNSAAAGIDNSYINGYNKNHQTLACDQDEDTTLNVNKDSSHNHSSKQISIKNIDGKTLMIEVQRDDTVDSIKETLEIREGIPSNMQHIIYAGKQLLNGRTILHYNIHAGSTLHLALFLNGGAETIAELIDLYMSTRCDYPHINEFIELNKFVLYKIGWDPVKLRKEWTKGLGKYGYSDRPNWKSLKQEYDTCYKRKELHTTTDIIEEKNCDC